MELSGRTGSPYSILAWIVLRHYAYYRSSINKWLGSLVVSKPSNLIHLFRLVLSVLPQTVFTHTIGGEKYTCS